VGVFYEILCGEFWEFVMGYLWLVMGNLYGLLFGESGEYFVVCCVCSSWNFLWMFRKNISFSFAKVSSPRIIDNKKYLLTVQ
jgi:hypothetical protein